MGKRKRQRAPKTDPVMTAEAVKLALLQRFNPIRGLTPASLALQLDNFNLGYLSLCALTWDAIERRDDVLKGVAAKRKKDVARLKREILTDEESDEAKAHADALNEFYDNCCAVNALDENERGGFPLLVRQMMDSVGKKYAVHEIVWQPGEELTAEFRFTPLWFFENRTGRLQFITSLGQAEGVPLEEGGWMVTTGDGLMEPCSIAYMFKNLPLKDWIAYSDKFGTPGILGRTNAAKGSDAGNAMVDCVRSFGQNWSGVVFGDDGTIKEPLTLVTPQSGSANLPFPSLIERMDRVMSTLWRGSDLSTMSGSQDNNVGASVQADEAEILIADDAAVISETLHWYVDRWVILQKFGTDRPLARVKLVLPEKENVELDLQVDDFLIRNGAKLGARERMEHYGRPEIEKGDEPMGASQTTDEQKPGTKGKPEEQANEAERRLRAMVEQALANAAEDEARDARGRWTIGADQLPVIEITARRPSQAERELADSYDEGDPETWGEFNTALVQRAWPGHETNRSAAAVIDTARAAAERKVAAVHEYDRQVDGQTTRGYLRQIHSYFGAGEVNAADPQHVFWAREGVAHPKGADMSDAAVVKRAEQFRRFLIQQDRELNFPT